MENKKEKLLVTDVFLKGARTGWNIAVTNVIPSVLMAFVIIYILKTSGVLGAVGGYLGFLMAPVGLPGEAVAVILAAFLSWGGAAGVVVALFLENIITVDHVAILVPGIALVGSTVQYMGRIIAVMGIHSKHYGLLFLICALNSYAAMLVMSIIIR